MHFHQFIVKTFFIILMRTWMSLWFGKTICWFLHNANNAALTGLSNLPSHLNNSFSAQKIFKALRTTCNFLLSKLLDFLKSIVIETCATRYYQQKVFFKVPFFNNFFFRLFTNLLIHEAILNSFCKE